MILNKELRSKLSKFKQDKRAYFSFLFLLAAFLLTLPAELICNVRPILLTIDGKPYLPIFIQYSERDFGGTLPSEPDYKSEDFMLLLSGQHQNRSINQKDNDQTVFSLTLQDFEEEAPNAFVVEMDDFGEELRLTEADAF